MSKSARTAEVNAKSAATVESFMVNNSCGRNSVEYLIVRRQVKRGISLKVIEVVIEMVRKDQKGVQSSPFYTYSRVWRPFRCIVFQSL